MAVRSRNNIGPAFNDLERELKRLIKFNSKNIGLFNSGQLSRSQIDLLIESTFFNSYRHYENYIRESFLLCCINKLNKRPKVISYLNAKNFEHAEKLLKSTSPFLDWAHPDKLIQRSELFLANGYPFKSIMTTHRTSLLTYKRLRNHIAHDSVESLSDFKKVLVTYHGTLPLALPSVGKHLLEPSLTNPAITLVDDFFGIIQAIAGDIASP